MHLSNTIQVMYNDFDIMEVFQKIIQSPGPKSIFMSNFKIIVTFEMI